MKMFNSIIFYLFVFLISTASSCKKDSQANDELITINNADFDIQAIISFNYPDTSLHDKGCIDCNVLVEKKSSHNHFYFPNSKYGWENRIKENNDLNTLTMFIVHVDTFRAYSFEELQSKYNILKRYDLSINQLKSQDWKVTYP